MSHWKSPYAVCPGGGSSLYSAVTSGLGIRGEKAPFVHCYRCGRRVADRSTRCENCGQKFNYGDPSPKKAEPDAAPPGPPIVPAASPAPLPPPPSKATVGEPPIPVPGLRDSIFEVSRTS